MTSADIGDKERSAPTEKCGGLSRLQSIGNFVLLLSQGEFVISKEFHLADSSSA